MNRRLTASLLAAVCMQAALQLIPARAGAAGANATCTAALSTSLGEYDPQRSTAALSRPGAVRISCGLAGVPPGRSYLVTVDIQPPAGGYHVMQNVFAPGKPLKYEIYLPDGKLWFDGSGRSGHVVASFASTGTQVVPVEIRVPAGQDAAVGSYVDPSLTFVIAIAGPI